MGLKDRLGKQPLFFDGAMGTMLSQAGLPAGALPDLWNLEQPQRVLEVHRAYLRAGCDIVKTNTFGANALKLAPFGATPEQVVAAGVALARQAAGETGREAFVALDIGPTGKLLAPLGELAFEQAVGLFAQMIRAGAQAGADCVLIETMTDVYELKAAVLAAKETCALPVFCTVSPDETGKLLTGADLRTVAALLEGLRVDAMGLNCGAGPDRLRAFAQELATFAGLPLLVNPNAGLPLAGENGAVYDLSPDAFAQAMLRLPGQVWLMGGCCGTTPAHIEALVRVCGGKVLAAPTPHPSLTVTSYAQSLTFGKTPVLIGERLNPTGKPRLGQALRAGDLQYVINEGAAQQDAGAHLLDVNVGLPGVDEAALLPEAVAALQSVCPLPLQLDTADGAALEKAMRRYNGKPLVNSVNGKQESLQTVLPLVKKYGGGLVALTLDENGIPETARGRLEIARRIVARAESLGIARREILVDVLTLPVSASPQAANVTLQALRLIKRELGVRTVLGVSNVSFGLPRRANIHAAFFLLALQAGLDAAILNPLSPEMMRAYYAFCALTGRDAQCRAYIDACGAEETAPPEQAAALRPRRSETAKEEKTQTYGLYDAVVRGLPEAAAKAAAEEAKSRPALEVIDACLVPALDTVGQRFEAGTLFLPQLLKSAEAAQAAFGALRGLFQTQGQPGEPARTVVLATVQGDIHDIGKNIVKVLLENYRFRVVDLGKDVPPETVLEAVRREGAKLVGLSALMTTTLPSMRRTIELLHEKAPDCKIMAGGAVLTEAYAAEIGADFYGKDAMASVQFAKQVLAQGD